MSFSKYISDLALNHQSKFEYLAQAALEYYYLIPYPGSLDNRPHGINRLHHGALHACMVARHVDLFLALYQKYSPELLHNLQGDLLSEHEIKLLKLSAIYHDAANTGEVYHDEAKHAEIFRNDLQTLGFTLEEIEPFAHAIQYKDAQDRSTKTIFQKIIHDADCLDIVRIKEDTFQIHELDSYLDLTEIADFINELSQIIQNQMRTASFFKSTSSNINHLHIQCELSENCYLTYCHLEREFLLKHIVLTALSEGYEVASRSITLEDCTVLDLYNRASYITKMDFKKFALPGTPLNQITKVIEKYNSNGIFVRIIDTSRSEQEFSILKSNQQALLDSSIQNAQQMRNYLLQQQRLNSRSVFTPEGFKWRPCSLIKKGLPIILFKNQIGLIIDPDESSPVYFYKKNALSKNTALGNFEYTPHRGGLKDLGSHHKLLDKLTEIDARRCGASLDLNYRYYGNNTIPHNEILANYSEDNIIGIIVPELRSEEINALILRSTLGIPLRPLFRYSSQYGLISVTPESIMKKSTLSINRITLFDTLSENAKRTLILGEIYNLSATFIDSSGSYESMRIWHRDLTINTQHLDLKTCRSISSYVDYLLNQYGVVRNHENIINIDSKKDIMLERDTQDANIILRFSNEISGVKLMNKIIMYIMDFIDKILLGKEFTYEQILATTDFLEINNIGVVSRRKVYEYDFVYSFQHPYHREITCSAKMQDKQAIIFICTSDRNMIAKSTLILPKLIKKYFEQLTIEINTLINDPGIRDYLNQFKLPILNFNFSATDHYPLVVNFFYNDISLEKQISLLLDFFHIPTPKKIRKMDSRNGITRSFVIENLDLLEDIKAQLCVIKNEIYRTKAVCSSSSYSSIYECVSVAASGFWSKTPKDGTTDSGRDQFNPAVICRTHR